MIDVKIKIKEDIKNISLEDKDAVLVIAIQQLTEAIKWLGAKT